MHEGTITNSVIYGNLDHELAIDTLSDPAITLNFNFTNNLIRSITTFTQPFFVNNLWNTSPQFRDEPENDFRFWSTSPLNGAGSNSFPTSNGLDIEETTRDLLNPDIGAYEY